eukprot:CAMPEP_0172644760 /NCGR_PEP_ID=MMETSP1068-20121228/239379_1 /TAXON_ID=35684 /ORGANISM="Pseudopedinella elastica, Strain CCMP716" /LENGTH=848 /DNA_ID=CAMNT_0013458973 /DNA_START=205 /DNA_END=2751 /DNA_ORIENTATION=-
MAGRILLATVLVAQMLSRAHAFEEISIRVTSPDHHRNYQTRGLIPGVTLKVSGDGPLAAPLLARPDDYELCVDFSAPNGFVSCKGLASSDNLASVDLSSMPLGEHVFRAFLRPKPGAGEKGLLTQEALASTAVQVPYSSGPEPPPTPLAEPASRAANQGEWVVGLHFSHDAHVAVTHRGEPVVVLELERLVEKRYFSGLFDLAGDPEERERVVKAWRGAAEVVAQAAGRPLEAKWDRGVFNMIFTEFGGPWEPTFRDALNIARDAFPAKRWTQVDHHGSHATLGLWDAHRELGLRRPLILSYDGGGDDGYTLAFLGNVDDPLAPLRPIKLPQVRVEMNFGNAYAATAAALPEVARRSCPWRQREVGVCNGTGADPPPFIPPARLALSGKLMGYAGLGRASEVMIEAIAKEFKGCAIQEVMMSSRGRLENVNRCVELFGTPHGPGGQPYLDTTAVAAAARKEAAPLRFGALAEHGSVSRREQRDVAASAQLWMEREVVALLAEVLAELPGQLPQAEKAAAHTGAEETGGGQIDGIVLVGGCGLNVRVNSEVSAAFPSLPVHVPAAPSDCGLALGSCWVISPPPKDRPPLRLHLLGPTLFDLPPHSRRHTGQHANDTAGEEEEEEEATGEGYGFDRDARPNGRPVELLLTRLGGRKVTTKEIASLLADEQIMGVVRGRSEHGPRALGHRSLLGSPNRGMKERMNALKEREWYRPVAPMVASEDADRVFVRDSPERPVKTPFMSFAPRLTREAARELPAITHADETARPQTVSSVDDPWLHGLLMQVKELTGWAVLINTSFNTKGKPILNRLSEALELLHSCEDLDLLLVEDFLFRKTDALPALEALGRDS